MKVLHVLGDEVAGLGGVSRALFVDGALRELNVGLLAGNYLCGESVDMLARSSTSFQAGLSVPADECMTFCLCCLSCFLVRFVTAQNPFQDIVAQCGLCSQGRASHGMAWSMSALHRAVRCTALWGQHDEAEVV
jgi:hypothetical protein